MYLKKVACYPQLITKDEYDKAIVINIPIGQEQDQKKALKTRELVMSVKDKLLLNLMAVESKKLTTRTYFSRALSDFLTN